MRYGQNLDLLVQSQIIEIQGLFNEIFGENETMTVNIRKNT